MEEKREIQTVAITIDEYFDLRQKAEMNGLLMERIGIFEAHLANLDERVTLMERSYHEIT